MYQASENAGASPEYEVHFEPGMHSLKTAELDDIIRSSEHGNPNANEWNEAVTTRMHSYRPGLLAVDSLFWLGNNIKNYPHKVKEQIWLSVPDRPSIINDTDHIFVLLGDNVFGTKVEDGQWDSSLMENTAGAFGLMVAMEACGLAGIILDKYTQIWRQWQAAYNHKTGEYNQEAANKISRRNFFQFAGMIGIGTAMYMSPTVAAYSPSRPLSSAVEQFVEGTEALRFDRRFGERVYTDGRTALLISKTYDALSQVPEIDRKVGAVVMGNGHIPFTSELLCNPDKRASFIHRQTAEMYREAVTKPFFFNETAHTTVDARQQGVYDQQVGYAIFSVSEPDDKRFDHDPKKEIDRIVQFVGSYSAPSVESALKDLKLSA